MTENKSNSNYDNRPIGFFDSGVGGLTVLEKVQELLPNEDFIYFGDTKNMPYGEKSESELIGFATKIFDFLEKKGVKAVVMACNTTSAITYEKLKNNYNFKIYPIIQSVAKILSEKDIKRLGILATNATINSHVYAKEITKYNSKMEVIEKACPEWVKIVEAGAEKEPQNEKLISSKLAEMLWCSPDKVVLGCTHYPYLLNNLAKFTNREMFIDPAIDFAQFIKEDLTKNEMLSGRNGKGFRKFYVSSNPEQFKVSAKMFYDVKTLPEEVKL